MEQKEESLQKLTKSEDSKKAREYVAYKINESEQISADEFYALPAEERSAILNVVKEMNKTSDQMERSILHDLIDPLFEGSRYKSWERNHSNITCTISKQMQEFHRMPSVQEIAAETGLSRQTVNKHVKEFLGSGMDEEMERFKYLAPKVLAKVFKFAVNGDVRAARLYFEVIGMSGKQSAAKPTSIQNQQNNYITINGIQVTEEAISRLPEGQRNQLQQILQLAAQPISAGSASEQFTQR